MKKFKSLFYLGLVMLVMPVIIFIIVVLASRQSDKVIIPEATPVVVFDIKPKEIKVDTLKELEPIKPIKKKKLEAVIDSIKPIIPDTLTIKKDTVI